jgi:GT2 family glycosyltransferase
MSASAPKDVSVVVLNWNTKNLLEKFIPYIQQTEYEGMEIVVADNASTDGSVNLLKDSFPQVRVIELAKNLGYAGGYNEALKQINTPFAVLLNSDVEVHPNWLSPMMSMMKQDDSIGAIQPKILDIANRNRFEYAGACGGYMDKYGYAFCRGRLFNNCEEDEGQYDERMPIFWASGAALAGAHGCLLESRWFRCRLLCPYGRNRLVLENAKSGFFFLGLPRVQGLARRWWNFGCVSRQKDLFEF